MTPGKWLEASSASARRELRALTHRPAEIIFCWIMPLVWMLIVWGLTGNGMVQQVPVAFVDQDHSSISRSIANQFSATRSLGLDSYIDNADGLEALRTGKVYALISIPQNYGKDTLSGKGSSISLYLDENRFAVASTILADVNLVISNLNTQKAENSLLYTGGGIAGAQHKVDVIQADFYGLGNPASSFGAFLGSSLLPSILQLGALLCFATTLIREQQDQSFRSWMENARGSLSASIFGKLFPSLFYYFLLCVWYIALFVGAGGWANSGSLVIWTLSLFFLILAMAGIAVLFVALAPSWHFALVLCSAYVAPALPFTGSSIPLDTMGPWVASFAQLIPLTWFLKIQSEQWVLGGVFTYSSFNVLILSLFSIIPFTLGIGLMRLKIKRVLRKMGIPFTEGHRV